MRISRTNAKGIERLGSIYRANYLIRIARRPFLRAFQLYRIKRRRRSRASRLESSSLRTHSFRHRPQHPTYSMQSTHPIPITPSSFSLTQRRRTRRGQFRRRPEDSVAVVEGGHGVDVEVRSHGAVLSDRSISNCMRRSCFEPCTTEIHSSQQSQLNRLASGPGRQ